MIEFLPETKTDAEIQAAMGAKSNDNPLNHDRPTGALADKNTVGTSEIDDEAVTLAKLAHIATARILGRTTGETGDVEALTAAQATALLNEATLSVKGLLSSTDYRKLQRVPDAQGSQTGAQSITPDLANGGIYDFSMAAGDATLEVTFNNAVNMQIGDIIILTVTDWGGVDTAPAFGADYEFAGDDPSWTESGTDQIVMRYNGSKWRESGLRTALNVEDGATADQTDAEIETAYNNQVTVASEAQVEDGTSTTVYRLTPQRVHQGARAAVSQVTALGNLGATPSTSFASVGKYTGTVSANITSWAGISLAAGGEVTLRLDNSGGYTVADTGLTAGIPGGLLAIAETTVDLTLYTYDGSTIYAVATEVA